MLLYYLEKMLIIIYRKNHINITIMIIAIKGDSILHFENIYECSRELNIDPIIISECLLDSQTYRCWKFISELAMGNYELVD